MHLSLSVFRYITVTALLLSLGLSCKDIVRDNVLDPKNPASYRPQITVIEAFVNTQNDAMYNENMLMALYEMEDRYPGKILIAEYHRNTDFFEDSLSLPESENLYESYIEEFDNQKGVPDVFINGVSDRVKGASGVQSAIERVDNAIQPFIVANSYFTLEPAVSKNGSTITFHLRIARLGTESAGNILVKAVFIEKLNSEYLQNVVRHIDISNLIPEIEPGEQKQIDFPDFSYQNEDEMNIVFTVLSTDDIKIQQSIEVKVP